ncbi:MAG: UxaA family hydrolase [Succinivibrionaceae bacterium]|nr:UxaA family hydrolase [Succinivibrionaceae bacterium]
MEVMVAAAKPCTLRINDRDNVAIALRDLRQGEEIEGGIVLRDDIPQAHKVLLGDARQGDPVYRYGVELGTLLRDTQAGSLINEHSLALPPRPGLSDLEFARDLVSMGDLPQPPRTSWMGYRNSSGPAGTRNLLGIVTTVQCAAGVIRRAVERIRSELLPRFPHVDGVVAVTHPYGCGVAINAPDAVIPIRSIRNLIRHPNFGGEIMVVGLGCEKLTFDRILEPHEITPENTLLLQSCHGHDEMMGAIMAMAELKLGRLERRRREELPLSDLLIGMQCGGSDAFSGITANPSAGYASDMLVSGGATVMFSEVTEFRDGVHLLSRRCVDRESCERLAREVAWYDRYLEQGGVDRDANPSPGNKAGGLSNIVEKAMGSIAKSGRAPISEVIGPGERPTRRGLICACTPASDIVCGPSQVASGIGLQLFMTGRGTPYGLEIAPVIKICSRNEMRERWFDMIDISAGDVALGKRSIAEVGTEIFNMALDVASGIRQPFSDQYGFHNDMCIFNPAPIT